METGNVLTDYVRWFATLVAALLCVMAPSIAHAVNVSGSITGNTTWTAAGGPYVLTGDVTVEAGATLTIQPGTLVQGTNASGNDVELVVNGTLLAVGTAATPIRFEGVSNTGTGYWEGLRFTTGAVATVQHAAIRNTDYAIEIEGAAAPNITLSDIVVERFARYAVNWLPTGTDYTVNRLSLTRARIRGPEVGTTWAIAGTSALHRVLVRNSHISGVTFALRQVEAEANDSIFSDVGTVFSTDSSGTATLLVDFCTVYNVTTFASTVGTANPFVSSIRRSVFQAVGTFVSGRKVQTFSQNVYSGTGTLGGAEFQAELATQNIAANALLRDPENDNFEPTERSPARYFAPSDPAMTLGAVDYAGAPSPAGLYGYWYTDLYLPAGVVYDLTGDMVIASGAEVTMEAGVVIRATAGDVMRGNSDVARSEVRVEGVLALQGTAVAPVRFVGEGTSRGQWTGLVFPASTQTTRLEHVEIGHADHGLFIQGPPLQVAHADIHNARYSALYVVSGNPNFTNVSLRNSDIGARLGTPATGTGTPSVGFTSVDAYFNTATGVLVRNANITWTGGRVFRNGGDGVSLSYSGSGPRTPLLSQLTIASNGENGVHGGAEIASNVTIRLVGTVISNNSDDGIEEDFWDWYVRFQCSGSIIWDNYGGNYERAEPEGECLSMNPMYASLNNDDFTPTEHSPLRHFGPSESRIGAVPYTGLPSPSLMGVLWDDFTFRAEDSPYRLGGDLIVPPGTTVRFEPGVVILPASTDAMKAGVTLGKTEMLFMEGSFFQFPESLGTTLPAPVEFRSEAFSPGPGDWTGLRFQNVSGSIQNVRVRDASTGIEITGRRTPSITNAEILYPSLNAISVSGVSSPDITEIRSTTLMGSSKTSGVGILATRSNVRVSSSFIGRFLTGFRTDVQSARGTWQAAAVNNTFVELGDGFVWNRGSGFIPATVFQVSAHNNLFEQMTTSALRELATDALSTLSLSHNAFADVSLLQLAGTQSAGVGNVVGAEAVTLVDPSSPPRWWSIDVRQGSALVDSGSPVALPDRDLYGAPRTIGSAVDIGAVEYDPTRNLPPVVDLIPARITVGTNQSFLLDGSSAFDPDGSIQNAYWISSTGWVSYSVTHSTSFSSLGTRVYFFVAIDDQGAVARRRVQVDVVAPAIANANGPYTVVADGVSLVRFSSAGSTATAGTTYVWDFGNGSTGEGASPTSVYTMAGNYDVSLIVTDARGVSARATARVNATDATSADTRAPVITHTESAAIVAPSPRSITANVTDASGVAQVVLHYRRQGSAESFELPMSRGASTQWTASLTSAQLAPPGIHYWFVARDASPAGNSTRLPGATLSFFGLNTDDDRTPPVITHTAVPNNHWRGSPVEIVADIVDASGLSTATVCYNSGVSVPHACVPMQPDGRTQWRAFIPASATLSSPVAYSIHAMDASAWPESRTVAHEFTIRDATFLHPIVTAEEVPDTVQDRIPVDVTAQVVLPGAEMRSVTLWLRRTGTFGYTAFPMSQTIGTEWRVTIPPDEVVAPGIDYYVEASTTLGGTGRSTPLPQQFAVPAGDVAGPGISHTEIADGRLSGESVLIDAVVTDDSTITSVRLQYQRIGAEESGIWTSVGMPAIGGGLFRARIPADSVEPPGVRYVIRAEDSEGNQAVRPTLATLRPYDFTVLDSSTIPVSIAHTQQTSLPWGENLALSATVSPSTRVTGVTVRFALGTSTTFESYPMALSGGLWTASIPASAIPDGTNSIRYYLEAVDTAGAATVAPVTAPGTPWTVSVIYPDLTPPVLRLTLVPNGRPEGTAVSVSTTATDTSGISTVTLYYRPAGASAWTTVPMASSGGRSWTAAIPAAAVVMAGVQYYVSATDAAPTPNTATAPAGAPDAFESFTVTSTDFAGPTIAHVLPALPILAGDDVRISVNANDPAGVAGVALFWRVGSTGPFQEIPMEAGVAGEYSADIAAVEEPEFTYYIRGSDLRGNVAWSPSRAPASTHQRSVTAPDRTGPVIVHTPIPDGRPSGSALAVVANITDASGVATVRLNYRATGSGSFVSQDLSSTDGEVWTGEIPATAYTTAGLEYYLEAADSASPSNTATLPAGAPAVLFTVTPPTITVDGTSPIIRVAEFESPTSAGRDIRISAEVTDDTGIESVTLFFRQGATGAIQSSEMTNTVANNWGATIPAAVVSAPGLQFYVSATDASPAGNLATSPTDAPTSWFLIDVTAAEDTAGPVIVVNDIASPQPASTGVPVSATVSDDSGVAAATVHFRHADAEVWTTFEMDADSGDNFSGIIPAEFVLPGTVFWYVGATDSIGNRSTNPLNGAESPRSFVVSEFTDADVVGPTLSHTPDMEWPVGTDLPISAVALDVSVVANVLVHFTLDDGDTWEVLTAERDETSDTWSAVISGEWLLEGTLFYYLEAFDASEASNRSSLPSGAPIELFSIALVADGGDTGPDANADAGSDSGGENGDDATPNPDTQTSDGSPSDDASAEADTGGEEGESSADGSSGGCSHTSAPVAGTFALLLGALAIILRRRNSFATR